MAKQLETFDAAWILQQPSTDPIWVVEDLLPTGVHVLAGAPKVGKSWLVLDLGLCVTTGMPFWGFATQESPVLYLCLEDTMSRIQRRLWTLTNEASEQFHFAVAAEKITSGLIEQLTGFLAMHPDTRLIVLDTLQVIRQASAESAYAADYRDINVLKKFADANNLAILVIHHTRKMGDADVFNTVSGTNGISGSADSTMVLVKDMYSSSDATLSVTGRDVEFQELKLCFHDCRWELVEKTSHEELEEREIPDAVMRILDFMAVCPYSWQGTATKLIDEAGIEGVNVAVLGKYLAQHRSFLSSRGISYSRRHEREGNIISLDHIAVGEGGERCEG